MEGLGECIPSFARGLEILVVDHDMMSLMRTAWLLEQLAFNVTTTEMGTVALSMIEAERERPFNLVMVNVHMIDMSILEFIGILLKKNIPVILTTTSEHTKMALKGLKEGASFFYVKPLCLDELRHVWQHVFRKKRDLAKLGSNSGVVAQESKVKRGRKPKNLKLEGPSGSAKVPKKRGRKPKNKETAAAAVVVDFGAGNQVTDDPNGKRKISEEEDLIMSGNELQAKKIRTETFNESADLLVLNDPKGKSKLVEEEATPVEAGDEPRQTQNSLLKERENKETVYGMDFWQIASMSELAKEDTEKEMRDRIMSIAGEKKNRVVWTKELHLKFTQAVSLLGDDKAVPKTILEMMNTPNLTHRQVSSHLQKYKNQVKQISNNAASPERPKSSGLNISSFPQVPQMSSPQAHEKSQEGPNLQKPIALYNSTFLDARFSFNERLKLASSYINAQNQNQLAFPFQGVDTMCPYVSSRNHIPTQGLDATSAIFSSINQVLPFPMQGPDAMPGHICPKEPSIAEKYLINFTEKNRDLPATNGPAAPQAVQGNQNQHQQYRHQQSIDDYSDILKQLEEQRGDLDHYFEWLDSDFV